MRAKADKENRRRIRKLIDSLEQAVASWGTDVRPNADVAVLVPDEPFFQYLMQNARSIVPPEESSRRDLAAMTAAIYRTPESKSQNAGSQASPKR